MSIINQSEKLYLNMKIKNPEQLNCLTKRLKFIKFYYFNLLK